MFDAIEKDILPQTEASVSDEGNKVNGRDGCDRTLFGAFFKCCRDRSLERRY